MAKLLGSKEQDMETQIDDIVDFEIKIAEVCIYIFLF